jgi:hypothetical protein
MRSLIIIIAMVAGMASPAVVVAQDSAQNGSNAVKASLEAVGYLGASGVQAVSAVAVVPVSVAATGSVVAGASLTEAGDDSAVGAGDSAAFASTPLPVTKKVIVAQPPPKLPYEAQQPAAKP